MKINEYLLGIVCAASLGTVADIVNDSFLSHRKNVMKYIRLGITLCVTACIIFPLTESIKSNVTFDFNYKTELPSYAKTNVESNYVLKRECEYKISEKIFEETGIKPLSVSINIKTEAEKTFVSEARIVLKEESAEYAEAIKNIANKALGAETVIEYENRN